MLLVLLASLHGSFQEKLVTHADEFGVSKWGLSGTGTVGTADTPDVWNCNPVWGPPCNTPSSSTYGFHSPS